MPEGPTILYSSEQCSFLIGQKLIDAGGYAEMDRSGMSNIKLKDIRSHGKYFIFVFADFFVTVHLGLFGRLLINETKKVNPSFSLHFAHDELNFYVSRIKRYSGKPEDYFDWRIDVMSEAFDEKQVYKLIHENAADQMIGDVLMDQHILAGVGNIIRNESLYRSKIQPESIVKNIPIRNLKRIITEAQEYSQEFYHLIVTDGGVKKQAQIYGKDECPVHHTPLNIYIAGKVKRKTYVCTKCQKLYVGKK